MTSRTSCFDGTIFRRDLRRSALLWVSYLLIWLLVLPMALFTRHAWMSDCDLRDIQYFILCTATDGASLACFFYGLALAWVLFSYLFKTKSAYFYASLPIRRETMFLTKYLTGMILCIVPNLLIMLATMLSARLVGFPCPGICLQWFGMNSLYFVFYFSFAVFCCMIVNQAVAMPVIYFILNCTVYVVASIVCGLAETFVYGMHSLDKANASLNFSPFLRASMEYLRPSPNFQSSADGSRILGLALSDWAYPAILAAVGILCAVLAFLLHRKSEMERCGDVVAVRWLRPVFRYAFTFGCALVIGSGIMLFVGPDYSSGNFCLTLICVLAGALVGYIAAQMMLYKTLRIFRKNWRDFLICAAVLIIAATSMRLDFFGFTKWVPAKEQIAAVSLSEYVRDDFVTDEAAIDQVLELHRDLVENRSVVEAEQEKLRNDPSTGFLNKITIAYKLQNGAERHRSYSIVMPLNDSEITDLSRRYIEIYNSAPFVVARNTPGEDILPEDIAYASVEGLMGVDSPRAKLISENYGDVDYYYNSINLTAQEAWELYQYCILPDLATSSLGLDGYRTHTPVAADGSADAYPADSSADVRIYLQIRNEMYVYNVTQDAALTCAYLKELGFLCHGMQP